MVSGGDEDERESSRSRRGARRSERRNGSGRCVDRLRTRIRPICPSPNCVTHSLYHMFSLVVSTAPPPPPPLLGTPCPFPRNRRSQSSKSAERNGRDGDGDLEMGDDDGDDDNDDGEGEGDQSDAMNVDEGDEGDYVSDISADALPSLAASNVHGGFDESLVESPTDFLPDRLSDASAFKDAWEGMLVR